MISHSRITFRTLLPAVVIFALQPASAWRRPQLQSRGDADIATGAKIKLRPSDDRPIYTEIMPYLQDYPSEHRYQKKPPHGEMILCTDINRRGRPKR